MACFCNVTSSSLFPSKCLTWLISVLNCCLSLLLTLFIKAEESLSFFERLSINLFLSYFVASSNVSDCVFSSLKKAGRAERFCCCKFVDGVMGSFFDAGVNDFCFFSTALKLSSKRFAETRCEGEDGVGGLSLAA